MGRDRRRDDHRRRVVAAYALATKVFPTALNPDETFARLREPFGYWNAVGLMAALGGPGCLWLGARRHGHAAVNALAYPVLALLLVTLLLAYSRGALLALVAGCAVWFAIVPLRLRGAAVLGVSTIGAVLTVAWAFGQDPLTQDEAPLALRETAGHELGLLLAAMSALLLAVGLAVGFAAGRRAPGARARRRAGATLLVALALVPVVFAIGLALSERGLGGSISDGFEQLFDPDASAKASPSNEPGRLTAVGSVRARYFADSLEIFEDRPLLGAGAGGFATARPQVRPDELDVRHAHGYVFQTLADLGIAGMAVVLALLAAWSWAALRATALLRRRGTPRPVVDAELVGLRTLLAVVVVFGVHSFVDWTWFIPGTTVLALLCAGWLAGRGPSPRAAGRAAGAAGRRGRPSLPRPRSGARAGGDRAARGDRRVRVGDLPAAARGERVRRRADHAGARERRRRARAGAARSGDRPALDRAAVQPVGDRGWLQPSGPGTRGARARGAAAAPERRDVAAPGRVRRDPQRLPRRARGAGPALYLDPKNTNAVTLFLDVNRQATAPSPPPATP
jgi:O-antigen ligase